MTFYRILVRLFREPQWLKQEIAMTEAKIADISAETKRKENRTKRRLEIINARHERERSSPLGSSLHWGGRSDG
jgi:nitric oxide reductase activation protein